MEFILDFDYDKSVVELYTESLANTFTDEGRLSGRKWVGEQIENLNEEDTSGNRQGECQETADYDTDCCQVQERL